MTIVMIFDKLFRIWVFVNFYVDDWTQCNVNCGEGFQTRKIINTEKCIATQFRSCWVGACRGKWSN